MDGEKFEEWIHGWYGDVKKVTNGPWLLIIDNWEGKEIHFNLPGVRIVYLPPNTTATYQPLDLGLILKSKIRYRSLMLRACIDCIIRMKTPNYGFKDNSGRGRWWVREGQLPHVADAICILNQFWSCYSSKSIIKCWVKSTCLSPEHDQALKQKLQDSEENFIDMSGPVSNQDSGINAANSNTTNLHQAVSAKEARDIVEA